MRKNRMLVRTTLALAAAALVAAVGVRGRRGVGKANGTVNGAGSTFVAPLVQKWVGPVESQLHITLNYSAVGSGAGIAADNRPTVDFGASDAPLQPAEFTACKGCLQIPWALAGTAVDYRLDHVSTTLKLTGAVLANIYLGKMKYWDDKTIKAINKGVKIPHTAISVFHRSDGSGTTYNFTDYLSHVSSTWKSHVGTGTAVAWPTGTGESHSSGVVAAVKATNGGIGYTDVEYAIQNKVKYAFMQNRVGNFAQPTLAVHQGRVPVGHEAEGGRLPLDREPAGQREVQARVPDLHVHVCGRCDQESNAAALKKLIGWAILTRARARATVRRSSSCRFPRESSRSTRSRLQRSTRR